MKEEKDEEMLGRAKFVCSTSEQAEEFRRGLERAREERRRAEIIERRVYLVWKILIGASAALLLFKAIIG